MVSGNRTVIQYGDGQPVLLWYSDNTWYRDANQSRMGNGTGIIDNRALNTALHAHREMSGVNSSLTG